ncbi:hypothetical protein ACSSV4_004045 [Roseovarius sp. MBR-154]|jgi:hypothetical protein
MQYEPDDNSQIWKILMEYVERFGLTDAARAYFLRQTPYNATHFVHNENSSPE